MKMKAVITDSEMDLGLCVLDVRESIDGKICYSGMESIVDKFIKQNDIHNSGLTRDIEIKNLHTFIFNNYTFDNGLFQTNRHGKGYLFNCTVRPRFRTGIITPFPGVKQINHEPIEGLQEVQFQITNQIICKMIRIKLHIYENN